MIIYTVQVYVKPGWEEKFREATLQNHTGTRKEPGNIRFDLAQSREETGKFFLYEVYESPEAVTAHKSTPHYLKWRETVEPWMAKPREGHAYDPCFPLDDAEW